ncbi:MAG: 6-carboxytetrahydropterin synthase [Bacteroidaceae bacterium]|nr:6-carboxytetrahydropterin synthase [Bacteroidaceae bacterium]
MYYVRKTIEVSGAHRLSLPYESKCTQLHGHNWLITVHCRCQELNEQGMVVDFTHVKNILRTTLDHRCLNDIFDFNPTAENIARWVCDQIPNCYRVDIQESANNSASYERD